MDLGGEELDVLGEGGWVGSGGEAAAEEIWGVGG
jgi:hypothetical protein